jgi:type VI secretion system protein ImpH
MAANVGTSADTLSVLASFERDAHRLDFFAVLRFLECRHAAAPRFGEGARPVDEAVRLGQEPSLAFAPSTLASFTPGDGKRPHRLSTYFFGLFGPQGPLPLHLTEFARERERNAEDPTFRAFADLFHHRLALLFYRAWADAEPTVSLDRSTSRRFDAYVGSVFGVGTPDFHGRDSVPDDAKLHLAGLFAASAHPLVALQSILEEFFRLPFAIEEFVGEWLSIPTDDVCLLGMSGARLGGDSVLGRYVWSCQHKFRVLCGPLSFSEFTAMLPGGTSLRRLRDLLRNFIGHQFEWDLNLILRGPEVPRLELGKSGALGWTTWLGNRQTNADVGDVIIHPAVALP